MRIAKLHMDSQDKTRFEIQGKSSVKYHLKANHVVEAKRWFWALNNAIQWAKDEAKEEERRRSKSAEALRQAKIDQIEGRSLESQAESASLGSAKANGKGLAPPSLSVPNNTASKLSTQTSRTTVDSTPGEEEASVYGSYEASLAQNEVNRVTSHVTTAPDADGEDDEYGDYASSRDIQPANKDAFNVTAQSAKLQLELLASVSSALQAEKSKNPDMPISDPAVEQALAAYEAAVSSLNGLVQDLLKISRDRDAYWQYRLDREADTRKMWEESMARIVQEHEELQSRIGESEEKRKRTKKALKEALENASAATSRPLSRGPSHASLADVVETMQETVSSYTKDGTDEKPQIVVDEKVEEAPQLREKKSVRELSSKRSAISQLTNISDSESDEEFFDAIDSGEIEVEDLTAAEVHVEKTLSKDANADLRAAKQAEIAPSFKGYEDPLRTKLKLDSDDRPKVSLWVSAKQTLHNHINLVF
ncbi:hypothetical protein M432DRAFT_160030 [Thermoascus aurantiacus ATCC 26904]